MSPRILASTLLALLAVPFAGLPAGAQLGGMTALEPQVLELGAEPRQQLRYRFVEGRTDTMAMDMRLTMAGAMNGTSMMDFDFGVVAVMDLTIAEVFDDGSARVEGVFREYDLVDSDVPAAEAGFGDISDALVGVTYWQVMDDRGHVLDFHIDVPDTLPPDLQQQLLQTTTSVQPLPTEAVGVGARWVAQGSMLSQGLPVQMATETEILGLDEDGVILGYALSADMDLAGALLGQLPPGVEVSVERLDMGGGGRMDIGFDRLVPDSEADIDLAMEVAMSAVEDDERVDVLMAFDMSMRMEVGPAE